MTNISDVPAAVNIHARFYGPCEEEVHGRDKYKLAFNETCSLADEAVYKANVDALVAGIKEEKPRSFLEERLEVINPVKIKLENEFGKKQEAETGKKLTKKQLKKIEEQAINEAVKRYVDNPKNLVKKEEKKDVVIVSDRKELKEWKDRETFVEKYEQEIEEHLERRLDNFLLQILCCYGTRLHFKRGPTQDQGESAKTLYADFKGKLIEIGPRNAAHSSTLPCLRAYDGKAWNRYKEEKKTKSNPVRPQGIYYLIHSDLYKGSNSTIHLPKDVNLADKAIDDEDKGNLRKIAVNILNQSASGKITVKKAMEEFINHITTIVKGKKRGAKSPGVKKALQIYYDKMRTIQEDFQTQGDEYIFQQINLLIAHEETSSQMKSKMIRIRAEALKRNMRGQAEIMDKVNALALTILEEIKEVRKKDPPNFHEAFASLLIESMRCEKDRERMTKLFALINPEKYGTRKAIISATKEMIKNYAFDNRVNRIKKLARTLSEEMSTLREEEEDHRGDSMRTLRAGKNWTQKKLGSELRKNYPEQPASQATICRTELGYRAMPTHLAKALSETFDVPEELLLPQFFFT